MNINDLESSASNGFKRNTDETGPGETEILTVLEIKLKAQDLIEAINKPERWDKETIARKTSAIVWFCARLSGMYGINLNDELQKRINETAADLEKPSQGITRIKDAKTFYNSEGKLPVIPRISQLKNHKRQKGP